MGFDQMLKVQTLLDSKNPTPEPWKREAAYLAELGELLQALKRGAADQGVERLPGWCWWKTTGPQSPSPVRGPHGALEELVDLWHFALGQHLALAPDPTELTTYTRRYYFDDWHQTTLLSLDNVLDFLAVRHPACRFTGIILLARHLGIAREEFEDAYLAKARKNLERWGYDPQGVLDEATGEPTLAPISIKMLMWAMRLRHPQARKSKREFLEKRLRQLEQTYPEFPGLLEALKKHVPDLTQRDELHHLDYPDAFWLEVGGEYHDNGRWGCWTLAGNLPTWSFHTYVHNYLSLHALERAKLISRPKGGTPPPEPLPAHEPKRKPW